jgi:hypothetical protein
MDRLGATVRRTVDLEVPAHVAYERMCRIEDYPTFRGGVRQVTAVAETTHRWILDGCAFTARLDERRPDELIRWQSVEGPACAERIIVIPLSPRRCRLVVETTGPAELLARLAPDLGAFQHDVERDHPVAGHYVNERPAHSFRHRSNWRDALLRGRSSTGPGKHH